MLLIQSQYLTDLTVQIFYIISVSLLTETTEIIKILTYLGCGHFHKSGKFLRRDTFYAFILKFPQISKVSGQSADHSL